MLRLETDENFITIKCNKPPFTLTFDNKEYALTTRFSK